MEGPQQDSQTNIVTTIDKNGGWLRKDYTITFFTLTKLADVQGIIDQKNSDIARIKAEKDEIVAKAQAEGVPVTDVKI